MIKLGREGIEETEEPWNITIKEEYFFDRLLKEIECSKKEQLSPSSNELISHQSPYLFSKQAIDTNKN